MYTLPLGGVLGDGNMNLFIHVDGIRCAGCVNSILGKAEKLGAQRAELDLRTNTLKVLCDEAFDENLLVNEIEHLGYTPILLGKELEELF